MTVKRKMTIIANLIRALVVFGLLVSLLPATTPAAAASCYSGSNRYATWFSAGHWTKFFYDMTTSFCRDFNVAVTGVPAWCDVWVDADYFGNGQWIEGSGSGRWIEPGTWYTPITNLRDNVIVRVRFIPSCNDNLVYVWTAS